MSPISTLAFAWAWFGAVLGALTWISGNPNPLVAWGVSGVLLWPIVGLIVWDENRRQP